MPNDFVALADKPLLLVAVLCVGVLIGMAAERALASIRRRAWRKNNRWRWNRARGIDRAYNADRPVKTEPTVSRRVDAADQLRTVMGAEFAAQPILNKSEARVFRELDRIVIGCHPGWQVMAQVSLGEILRCNDAAAFGCINSKRVDLLLVDENCQPRHAIEYQGGGHHQGSAAARDAVKKEALRRAGIGYHEVVAGQTTPSELRLLVAKLVVGPSAGAEPVGSELRQKKSVDVITLRQEAG